MRAIVGCMVWIMASGIAVGCKSKDKQPDDDSKPTSAPAKPPAKPVAEAPAKPQAKGDASTAPTPSPPTTPVLSARLQGPLPPALATQIGERCDSSDVDPLDPKFECGDIYESIDLRQLDLNLDGTREVLVLSLIESLDRSHANQFFYVENDAKAWQLAAEGWGVLTVETAEGASSAKVRLFASDDACHLHELYTLQAGKFSSLKSWATPEGCDD